MEDKLRNIIIKHRRNKMNMPIIISSKELEITKEVWQEAQKELLEEIQKEAVLDFKILVEGYESLSLNEDIKVLSSFSSFG